MHLRTVIFKIAPSHRESRYQLVNSSEEVMSSTSPHVLAPLILFPNDAKPHQSYHARLTVVDYYYLCFRTRLNIQLCDLSGSLQASF
jgi:Mn2+/Fe2+ NRAMP family transporter